MAVRIHPRGRRAAALAAAGALLLGGCGSADADTAVAPAATPSAAVPGLPRNAVADWVSIVALAVHNPLEPRSPASAVITHAVVHLAVYDAVVAIRGGHKPYAGHSAAPAGADLDAAVAAAAHRAALARVAPRYRPYLDARYRDYLAQIPDGPGEDAGIAVGIAAADKVLARRAGDGFGAKVVYQCSKTPVPAGEFEPDAGCGTQPIDAGLGAVKPFTFEDPARFRPAGPDAIDAKRRAADLAEVARLGGASSAARTVEQTQTAYFWAEHVYPHFNRNLLALARARGLDTEATARMFAMTFTAMADAAIAGFEAKYHYRTARPRTAVQEKGWVPLLTVNHPEYPSGHGFVTAALLDALAAFFGTREVPWTIVTSTTAVPFLTVDRRDYPTLDAVLADVTEARILSGLHCRYSMQDGIALGKRVAANVLATQFQLQR